MSRLSNLNKVLIVWSWGLRVANKLWRRLTNLMWTSIPQLTLFALDSGRLSRLTPRAVRHLVESGEQNSNRISVILEIGANDGEDTSRFLREFGGACIIHAFEPEPRAIESFLTKGFDQRVQLHQIALGESEGVAEFFQSGGAESEVRPGGWSYSGSIRRPKNHLQVYPWVTFEHSIKVPVRSLDAWGDEFGVGPIDFIWMDVQGAEADVIRGGQSMLRNTRFLYTEYSNHELYEGQATLKQLIELLEGWSVIAQFPNDVLFGNSRFVAVEATQ